MVNDFYPPLVWGARLAFWGLVCLLGSLPLALGQPPTTNTAVQTTSAPDWRIVAGGLLTLFIFNMALADRVLLYFHHLRVTEATVVFDALLVCKTTRPDARGE